MEKCVYCGAARPAGRWRWPGLRWVKLSDGRTAHRRCQMLDQAQQRYLANIRREVEWCVGDPTPEEIAERAAQVRRGDLPAHDDELI